MSLDDDPLALLQSMGLESAPAANERKAERSSPVGGEEVPQRATADTVPSQPEPAQAVAVAVAEERRRNDVLDILAAMSPVFRAAAVYPGVDGTPAQIEDAIRQMSRTSAQLADAVARGTDELEIDLRWRRRRATAFTADLVASYWLSSVIRQGGAAFDGLSLNEAMPRLARSIQTALDVVREQPMPADNGWSPSSAVLALAPLVLDLQRYADVIQTSLPDFTIEVDAAAQAVGAVAGEEVRLGVGRLGELVPESMRPGLASELMAHVGPMALAAWELERGGVLGQLQGAADAAAGLAILTGAGMAGGVPVAGVVDRLRPMVRRLVGTVEYAAREMLGVRRGA